ncbi:MAG: hypothetical protein EPO26_15775 [Chloroflexota bacterium]|nr:MAG: hypothetical protein EPO26_15775 [Chloroflexota bacterium]
MARVSSVIALPRLPYPIPPVAGRTLYIASVTAIGSLLLIGAIVSLDPVEIPRLIAFVACAAIAERITFPLPRGGEFSATTMVFATGVLLLPLPAAIAMGAVGTLIGEIAARKVWYRAAFNVGQIAITCTVAAATWAATSGEATGNPTVFFDYLPAALAAILVYYVANTLLVSGVLALYRGANLWRVWWDNHRGVLAPHLAMQVMGILFAAAYLFDMRAVIVLAVPAAITAFSYRQVRQLETTAASEREARARSERLAARWKTLAHVNETLSAALHPDAIVGAIADLAVEVCADGATVVAGSRHAEAHASGSAVDGFLGVDGSATTRVLPLRHADGEVGTLILEWQTVEPTTEQIDIAEALADRAALVLQNALSGEQAAEVATLREVSQMKSELLASVSHELTGPLALVVGYGELLKRGTGEEKQVRWMGDKILTAGQRLTRLVDDLLDAGRLESGRFSLDVKSCDVREICIDAIDAARAIHGSTRFLMDVPESALTVAVDATRLGQVLSNLLSNAARYGKQDGRALLSAVARDRLVLIAIEDDGPGIAPEDRERVFDKFYRAESAVARTKKGLGLGLTIARDIVLAHEGQVWVEEGRLGGARFVVALPLREPIA